LLLLLIDWKEMNTAQKLNAMAKKTTEDTNSKTKSILNTGLPKS
jgi:hypothetical protein